MPSPNRRPRLCIYGDSHLASARHAVDEGHRAADHFDVEFWGASGPLFRDLDLVDDEIRCRTAAAEEEVLRVNGQGRKALRPDDFDALIMYGARVRVPDFLAPYLHYARSPTQAVSEAVVDTAIRTFLNGRRSVRIARKLGKLGRTRIFVIPTTLDIWTPAGARKLFEIYPGAQGATAADRAAIHARLAASLAADGVSYLAQPDESIVHGVFTDPAYASAAALEAGDVVHKSGAFAALLLDRFLDQWAGQADLPVAAGANA